MEQEGTLVDPNTADLEALTALPGIGEGLATKIIEARPFESVEDLARVPGLGERTLERILPYLALEPTREPEQEVAPAAEEVEPAPPEVFSRTQTLAIALFTAAASVIVSLALMLAILVGVNRTLNVARHASIRNIEAQIRTLEARVGEVSSTLGRLDQRLRAVEGLSGRVTAMESEVQASLEDIDQAVEQVSAMKADMERLRQEAARTHSFFEALSQLLAELLQTGEMGP